jgi:hypothetical protein
LRYISVVSIRSLTLRSVLRCRQLPPAAPA